MQSRLLAKSMALVFCFLAAFPCRASEGFLLSVSVEGAESVEVELQDGRMVTPAGSESPSGIDQAVFSAPWTGRVVATGDGHVKLNAEGYWAPSISPRRAEAERVNVILEPAGRLLAALPPRAGQEDTALEVTFADSTPVEELEAPAEPRLHTAACTTSESSWQCTLPARRLDIRLDREGYMPIELWDTLIAAGETTTLEDLNWQRGGSLEGWVVSAEEDGLSAEVEIEPELRAPSADQALQRRWALRSTLVESDDQGFFRASGLAPGRYSIQASKEGFESGLRWLQVPPEAKLVLDEPLTLVPVASLEIQVDPPIDPWGDPWRIEVARPTSTSGTYESVTTGDSDYSGLWSRRKLPANDYLLTIRDSKNSTWVSETLEVFYGMPLQFYAIDLIPIRGELTLGGEGRAGEIVFGGVDGHISISVISDEEGRFDGLLPYGGRWPLELRLADGMDGHFALESVVVEKKPGKSYAELDIALPDTVLRGRVLEDGEPTRAVVLAVRTMNDGHPSGSGHQRRDISLVTKPDDGRFEVRGLSEGKIQLSAYRGELSSTIHVIELAEDMKPQEIELELQPKKELEGRLVSESGSTIANASILAQPNVGLITGTQSGLDGRFNLRFPPGPSHANLMILSAEGGLILARADLGARPATPVELTIPAASGSLVLEGPLQGGFLFLSGVGIRLDRVLSQLSQAGRLDADPEGGVRLDGLAPGAWSLCKGEFGSSECATAYIAANGKQRLSLETEPP